MWKSLNKCKSVNYNKVLDENLEGAYIELYSYHPKVRELFSLTIQNFKEYEELCWGQFLKETQSIIKEFKVYKSSEDGYKTASLGNKLRFSTANFLIQYELKADEILKPVRKFLSELIMLSDDEIICKKNIDNMMNR